MPQKTQYLTVDGTVNLLDALHDAGYTGMAALDQLVLYPVVPTNLFYINLGTTNVAPAEPTTGLPIGTGGVASSYDYSRADGAEFLDAATTFLHTETEFEIGFAVIGR